MPSTEEHVRLALQFRRFLDEARPLELPGRQIELAVAACYWSSLHLIDSVLAFPALAQPGIASHPDSEAQRLAALAKAGSQVSALRRHHRFLKDRYDDAMYRGVRITEADLREVFESHQSVVDQIERILRAQGKLPAK